MATRYPSTITTTTIPIISSYGKGILDISGLDPKIKNDFLKGFNLNQYPRPTRVYNEQSKQWETVIELAPVTLQGYKNSFINPRNYRERYPSFYNATQDNPLFGTVYNRLPLPSWKQVNSFSISGGQPTYSTLPISNNGSTYDFTKWNMDDNVPEFTSNTFPRKIPINNIDFEDIVRRGDMAELGLSPYKIRANAQAVDRTRLQEALRKQGTISMPGPDPSWLDRTLDILSNPTEAFGYIVRGQDLPTHMPGTNPYDMVFGFPGSVLKSGKNLLEAVFHPIDTTTTLGAAGINLFTNLTAGENLFDESYNNKALRLGLDFLNVAGGRMVGKDALRLYDRNFTKIGQALNQIEREGIEQGLSKWEIANRQMNEVGITSNQRQAYNPILSPLAKKYVTPVGYSGYTGENKALQTYKNILRGGVDYSIISPARKDAWNLYLGIPQESNTFRMANTSPVFHRSYSPAKLANMDIYSVNNANAIDEVIPYYINVERSTVPAEFIKQELPLFNKSISYVDSHSIFGGYNRRLNPFGLQYNDVWDLNPIFRPTQLLPTGLKNTLIYNKYGRKFAPLFYKTLPNGILQPREIKLSMDKFLGKPFMSHGVITEVNPNTLANQARLNIYNNMKNQQTMLSGANNQTFDVDETLKTISEYKGIIDQLNNYQRNLNSTPLGRSLENPVIWWRKLGGKINKV